MDFRFTKTPNRDFKEIAGNFWSAASKKLQKWRQKRRSSGDGSPVEKSIGNQLRDPRFSIDAGRFSLDACRVSVDDPRYSFHEPRASWDASFIGKPPMSSMLSLLEDSPVRIHVRTPPRPVIDEIVPGGSEQTQEYYTDSSSRRRKSLDRSSSTRKLSEIDQVKQSALKSKVSPNQDRDAKKSVSHSHLNSLRDDCSDIGLEENVEIVESSKKGTKKSKRWSWNIFGLLHRRNSNKLEGRSGEDRMFSRSWNVETRKGFDPKMMRNNSSVSWRSARTGGGETRRNSVDGYVSGKTKVSSSNERKIEDGMLKLYLTPGKGRRRGSDNATGSTNGAVPTTNPLGRNAMNIY